ncbi:glutathione S-transferase family protein [Ferrovibrio xuzhouensis]|uniref:Glutathione S-transferase family protein n=1 Tax=Ferrovibrio xuzhouensis TaxID=1576914 RepID=A0ABV7VAK8_9PROT
MLTLYYAAGSCALATHIALIDAGADYEAKPVDFAANQQRTPEYLAVNPKGRVPALVTPRGILTESPALLAYVAQSFPAAKLAPLDDAHAFAEVQAFNSYIATTVHVAHAHGRRGYRWADEPEAIAAMKRKAPQVMADSFALIEDGMLRGPWVMGERYSICDPYLFTMASWLEADGVDPARFPKILDHRNRMMERPAARQALAEQAA